MLKGRGFATRLTIAVTLAYLGPPILGLTFLVYLAKAMSTADVMLLMSGSILPFFIIGSTLVAVFFFRWFLGPVALLETGKCDSDKALQRMRSFLWVYWVVFLARHFTGVAVVILSSHSVLLLEESNGRVWLRMFGLAVMLSSLFGLPAFVYVVDFFATTFKKHTLREPLLRVRTRVFMIAVLLPVLLNTAVLQYLMPRIGGLNAELVALWFVLLGIAIVAAYNLMRSLDQSMTGLRRVSAQRNEGQIALRPDDLQLRSMDEFGVLTCEYRELLTNLQQQATLLDLRNQVLVTSNQESDSDVLLLKLLGIVSKHLESNCAALASITAKGDIEILASTGNDTMPSSFDAPPNLLKAVRASSMSILPITEVSWCAGDTSEFVVLPLRESSESSYQAVFATLDGELKNNIESNELRLLAQFGPEIAAAVRAAQIAKEKSTLEHMLLDAQRMEVVGRLAAGVAHDFNNILMVVSGAAGLIKLEAGDEGLSGVTENTELIMEASEKGADLTRQLLTFARPSEGKVAVLDMNEVVGSLDAFLRRLLPGEIQFEIELRDTAKVKANKGQIEQVITNLVINARDAMEGAGTLRLETSQRGTWFELRVVDTGSGMSPEVVSHIFEPFYSTKATSKGTGLGLATVYGIVKNSGGSIQVESTIGKGTSMIVCLPITTEVLLNTLDSSKPKQRSRNGSILLAEDNDNIRGIIVDLLLAEGFSVTAVANGTDAIEKIEDDSVPIDLLLTDIIMPGVKGTEVANRMAGQRPGVGILLMTGYADPEMLDQAIAAGRTIIQKPFAPEQLLVQIDTLLG